MCEKVWTSGTTRMKDSDEKVVQELGHIEITTSGM
jgi:hypothetical protein